MLYWNILSSTAETCFKQAAIQYPVVTIIGPRQIGKAMSCCNVVAENTTSVRETSRHFLL